MNGFEKRTQKKRNHILKVAQTLFKKHGIKKMNILDIAEAAEVSHVTIYHYWGNKEGLVEAVMAETLNDVTQQGVDILDTAKDFEEGLDRILDYEANRYQGFDPSFKEALVLYEKAQLQREDIDVMDSLRRFIELAPDSDIPVRKFSSESMKVFVYLFRYLKSHGFLDNPTVKKEITDFFKHGILDYTKDRA
jgi:AcrR family transcriptional regulator